jgi:hypothetical protein
MVQSFNIHHTAEATKQLPNQNAMATTLPTMDYSGWVYWLLLQIWIMD